MFVRLSINITSTIIPFYMEIVLEYSLTKDGGTAYPITICLLLSTLGSISNSLFFEKIIKKYSSNKKQKNYFNEFCTYFCINRMLSGIFSYKRI